MLPYIIQTLQNLFQNGVSEEDILKPNRLVTKIAKKSFLSNIQNDNYDDDTTKSIIKLQKR